MGQKGINRKGEKVQAMADMITFEQLRVHCRFTFLTIHKCSIQAKYGEHSKAQIVGIVIGKEVKSLLPSIAEEKLEVVSVDKAGVEEVLFVGMIESAELNEEGQYATLLLCAVSYTWKMDMERKSRSFQNLSMTYQDVVKEIAQEYGAQMTWNIEDRQLTYPLVQYKETDYSFIKRIVSHLGEGIVAGDCLAKAGFNIGIGSGNSAHPIDLQSLTYSLLLFQGNAGETSLWEKGLTGYEIEDTDFLRVGDTVSIQGRTYYVMERKAEFRHNVLICIYRVFPKQCFQVEKLYADTLRGAVIEGEVLETRQEQVKLHLDIDQEQAVSEAYEFPWKPITGNLFYCMPEKGTRAALYFNKNDEEEAAVIYNIRENGETCGDLADYNNRYFTTDHSKRMYLKPSEMGLLNMTEQNAEIVLQDASLLKVKTSNQLSLLAEGQVELKGKTVTITTPKEATLVRKDLLSPTVVNLCNAFDAIGKVGDFTATPQAVQEKKRKAAVPTQAIEQYSLAGVIEKVLSSIPADDLGSPVMEAVAGSMPIVSRRRG